MKILVINGPNLNFLGIREKAVYGTQDYNYLMEMIHKKGEQVGCETEVFQSNHEGAIIDEIQAAYGKCDGIIINPAGYTHTSVAIPDAIRAVGIPAVEVHISDIDSREDFRKVSYIRPACISAVIGKGIDGYREALELLTCSL